MNGDPTKSLEIILTVVCPGGINLRSTKNLKISWKCKTKAGKLNFAGQMTHAQTQARFILSRPITFPVPPAAFDCASRLVFCFFFSFPEKRNGIFFSSGVNYFHIRGEIRFISCSRREDLVKAYWRLSKQMISLQWPNYRPIDGTTEIIYHRRSATVSLETYPLYLKKMTNWIV